VVLSGNLIKKLPSDMGLLTCLTELRMDSNLLEKVHWSPSTLNPLSLPLSFPLSLSLFPASSEHNHPPFSPKSTIHKILSRQLVKQNSQTLNGPSQLCENWLEKY